MKIGFIGCGNMGGALARAVMRSGCGEVFLYDKDTARAAELAKEIGANAAELSDITKCNYVFLGVKPGIIADVTAEIAPMISKDTVIVSMAAGVAISKIEAALGYDAPVIRIMPNTPAAYGAGMILYTVSGAVTETEIGEFLSFMAPAGTLDEIPEKLIDAGSAVSGCGPAFVYMFIEALADGGVAAGLPREKALLYAARTAMGAALTVTESGKHPAALKDAVCSPGGSTIEGVLALEAGGVRGIVSDAVLKSYEKTKKLGK